MPWHSVASFDRVIVKTETTLNLGEIEKLDYTVILCSKMQDTQAFYSDVMGFPVVEDRENWVSFRVGSTLLTLRPRGLWSVCDDGPIPPSSAAIQLAFLVPIEAVDQCHRVLVSKSPFRIGSSTGQPS